jgi:hypothetical protein
VALKKKDILSLDLGTNMGYYVGGTRKAYTVECFKGLRCESLYTWLESQHRIYGFKHICYEIANHQAGAAGPIYHRFVGALRVFCMIYDVKYTGVHSGTAKKCFTGKGAWTKKAGKLISDEYEMNLPKAKLAKAATMAKCIDIGMDFDTDDGADAYQIFHTFVEQGGLK